MTGHSPAMRKRRGRPPGKRQPLRTPSDFRRAILRIAQLQVETMTAGAPTGKRKSLLTRNIELLAMGAAPNRLAAAAFVELARQAASVEQQLRPDCAGWERRPAGDAIIRHLNGQFASGGPSPNPLGRPRKPQTLMPSDIHKEILRAANEFSSIAIDGKSIRLTRFEQRYLELGSGRPNIRRIDCQRFVEMTMHAANVEHQLARKARDLDNPLAHMSDSELAQSIVNLRVRGDDGRDHQ